ncbi:Cell division coordinator CpoB [Eubacterium plexicaudatum ASF492]|uniref:Tetratricopeptide repeat protein n=1 Tax=Eubacterium plexicaudatum ASF492 TaxID=1235802 RepID=N2APT3_9FIRM|nr:Cell division coordinator CpoB [Eubacterium plexicaudatum ASF492]
MQCFKCGAQLGPEQTCPNCGMNVKMYKKLIAISNYLYNVGLERAKVRDLSGAVDSLKTSLQYYKGNIQARNLLGLIYYETGETVSALSEWVISKNQSGKDNIADTYLHEVQSNATLLNTVNQTIKKYNQALLYCQQGSEDLAVIQLKKILSVNPKLVKAHQLLALLYIRDRKYDLARKSLRTAEKIDRGNTTTMGYLAEIDGHMDNSDKSKKPKKKESRVEYNTGNDTIIQPTNLRDNSGWMMIVNILVGLVIGVTATYFLIVPSIRQTLQKDVNTAVSDANDTIASKNQAIKELEAQVKKLTKNVEDAREEKEASTSQITSYQKLLTAYRSYQQGEMEEAKTALAEVDQNHLDSGAKQVYESIRTEIDAKYLETAYNEGYGAYMSRNYQLSAELLQKVVDVDDTYHNGDAIYYLAQSYRIIEDYQKAAELYQKVIDDYPTSYKANNARYKYLPEVQQKLEAQ